MMEVMKQIVCETMIEWKDASSQDPQRSIDIVKATSNLLMKIVLACAFGRQNENPIIEQKENGKILKVPMG